MSKRLQEQIKNLRERIEELHYDLRDEMDDYFFKHHIDEFLDSPNNSDLEKAFFLMLNQFGHDHKHYFVVPHEPVLIPNVYDYSPHAYFEYEIDFAIYSGSRSKPIKIAVECDGLRSHRQRHNERDRRKDINLQAAGWIVLRIGSQEIHRELEAFENEEMHISEIATNVENIVDRTMDLITQRNYVLDEIRSMLTGYAWGSVTCPHCGDWQKDRLNKRRFNCRKCGNDFTLE
jgi:very-short-patch-repair endonuclease